MGARRCRRLPPARWFLGGSSGPSRGARRLRRGCGRFRRARSSRARRPYCRNDRPWHDRLIEESVITREEVVALLFTVSDISATLVRIERLLEEDDGEEDDPG